MFNLKNGRNCDMKEILDMIGIMMNCDKNVPCVCWVWAFCFTLGSLRCEVWWVSRVVWYNDLIICLICVFYGPICMCEKSWWFWRMFLLSCILSTFTVLQNPSHEHNGCIKCLQLHIIIPCFPSRLIRCSWAFCVVELEQDQFSSPRSSSQSQTTAALCVYHVIIARVGNHINHI